MSIEDIKELRKRTGVGVLEAKEALSEHGSIEAAVEAISKKIGEKNINAEVASEGRVAISIKIDLAGQEKRYTRARMVEMLCQTDFTANTKEFLELLGKITKDDNIEPDGFLKQLSASTGEEIALGKVWEDGINDGEIAGGYNHKNRIAAVVVLNGGTQEIAEQVAMHVVGMKPKWLSVDDVPIEVLVPISEEVKKKMQNKPPEILQKIIEGKMMAYYKDNVLLEQKFIKDDKKTVKEWLGDVSVVKYNLIEAGVIL